MTTTWALRTATDADVEPIAELRAVVMRPDLERLGRYDPQRVRQRLRDGFSGDHTRIVEVAGFPRLAGCVTVRPDRPGALLLEHFYLDPELQGRGLGGAVLAEVLEHADAERLDVRLNVLQGSPARRLYERHGFALESEDPVDVFLHRTPTPRHRVGTPRKAAS
ncbi:GNAT family N-acetyltransferase [Kitasatospora sp. NPDC049285]|uniref:GNAT family N-acetyltransferase n=1 Tax=Kitasatospora sp. NPDC049285 TaxID=3157096 RepID=UPI0034368FC6